MFSLTSVGTIKYYFVIKTIEVFNFLPLIGSSVTTGFSLLSLIILAIISSKHIDTFWDFFLDCISQDFYKKLAYLLSIQ